MEFAAEGPKAIPLWVNGHAFLTVTDAFYDVVNPVSGEAVYRRQRLTASYVHLYFPSNPQAAARLFLPTPTP